MYTICETPLFTKYCLVYGLRKSTKNLKTLLALNPEAGDVEPNSEVASRKIIRWTMVVGGKKLVVSESSTFNRLTNGEILVINPVQ